jgi:uncharacterized protein (TIGR01244 family)
MSIAIRPLNPAFAVTAQLTEADIPALAAQGFATLINNRPDGEGGSNQPLSSDLEQAAKAAGLRYVYLPVVSGAITAEQALAMKQALANEPAPVLAFCRSGARSSQLYSLAQTAN